MGSAGEGGGSVHVGGGTNEPPTEGDDESRLGGVKSGLDEGEGGQGAVGPTALSRPDAVPLAAGLISSGCKPRLVSSRATSFGVAPSRLPLRISPAGSLAVKAKSIAV